MLKRDHFKIKNIAELPFTMSMKSWMLERLLNKFPLIQIVIMKHILSASKSVNIPTCPLLLKSL